MHRQTFMVVKAQFSCHTTLIPLDNIQHLHKIDLSITLNQWSPLAFYVSVHTCSDLREPSSVGNGKASVAWLTDTTRSWVGSSVLSINNCVVLIFFRHAFTAHVSFCWCLTRPKTKFPTCPVYQNMKFPHISYTYLAEDRAEFHENEQNV